MALKILATGDIHIGKKSSGINRDAEEGATKYTWNRIVDYAIENDVDVVALTGDVVDRDNKYFEAIGPLQTGFERLKHAKISVYMVVGNHDYDVLPQLVDSDRYDNVHLLGAKGTWEKKTFRKNGDEIQFVGWSFPKRHFTEDPLLSFNIAGIDPTITTIGLLHGDVGMPESNYAPIDLNNFRNQPANVWLLGHIHKPQILRQDDPLVCYPGSPHALSAKEQGMHGAVLLTINSPTNIEAKQIALSPVRYETIAIDITDKENEREVRNAVTSQLYEDALAKVMELDSVSYLIYDLVLIGQHSKIRELEGWVTPMIEGYNQEMNGTETQISVRKVVVDVKPKVENLSELALESSPAGILAKTIIALNRGESTEFSEKLLTLWNRMNMDMKQAAVYQPLRGAERFDRADRDDLQDGQDSRDSEDDKDYQDSQHAKDAKQYLLNECNRILTELIEQQK